MKHIDNTEYTAIRRKYAREEYCEVSKFKIEKKSN